MGRRSEDQETIRAGGGGDGGWVADEAPDVFHTEQVVSDQPGQRAEPPASETVVLRTGPLSLAWLVATAGSLRGRLFQLQAKGTIIGRDARSDIILDDQAVSGLHAKVRSTEEDEGGRPVFTIVDMASKNGTFVNDEEVTKRVLQDGDKVVIGETTMVFKQV